MDQIDIETLPQFELIQKYYELYDKHTKLSKSNEETLQNNHILKLEKSRLCSAEQFLQSELESISSQHSVELQELTERYVHQIEEMKQRNHDLIEDNARLETKCSDLEADLMKAEQTLKEIVNSKPVEQAKPKPRLSDVFKKEEEIEAIRENYLSQINELKQEIEELKSSYSNKSSTVNEMKEKLLCVEENLESKKSELSEKNELIDSLQEQVSELNVELSVFKSAPANENQKGNSLFAEVDDQRQKMRQILQTQRTHYIEMKKALNMQQMENRRLKRENENIKEEISKCSNMLGRADQVYTQSLSSQNSQLLKDNRKLEEKLSSLEKALTKKDGMGWVESLLNTSEVKELKDKLYNYMLEKNSLDENFLKTQKELAKFKLEYIKLKILIGRIVDSYNVNLDDIDTQDIKLNPELLLSVRMEHDQSVMDQTLTKFDEETIMWISNAEEKPEVIDLDVTDIKMEATSVGLSIKKEKKTPLKAALCAGKSPFVKGSSTRKLLELLTPSRNHGESSLSSVSASTSIDRTEDTLEIIDMEIETCENLSKPKVTKSPAKRQLEPSTSENSRSSEVIPSKIPKLSTHQQSVQRQEEPLKEIHPKNTEDHHKAVTFSDVVETKTIDSSAEAVQARKKQGVIVKRITIPSKIIKKEK